MLKPKNECIDCKAFASLILDYEFPAEPEFYLPAYVSCRVLIEDLMHGSVIAETREQAIEIFRSGKWKRG